MEDVKILVYGNSVWARAAHMWVHTMEQAESPHKVSLGTAPVTAYLGWSTVAGTWIQKARDENTILGKIFF